MSERIWFLKGCELFARLTPAQLGGLEARARLRKFPRNSPIYHPGDESDGVLLLAQGRIRICDFTGDGKQMTLAFIEPGELFGELAAVDDSPRDERAEAIVASTVIFIPADALRGLFDSAPELALGITRLIGLRCRRIERRLKMLLFRSNRERLVNLLLDLAEQYGRPGPEGLSLEIRLSHQDLASVIGSTREAVTIVLGELRGEGSVRMARQSIILTNPGRLAKEVDRNAPAVLLRAVAPVDGGTEVQHFPTPPDDLGRRT